MFASCQSEGESSWPLAQGAPDHTFCTHLPHNPRAMTLLMRCPCIYQMSEDTRGVMIAAKSSRKGPQKALAAVQSAISRRQVCINPISPACTPVALLSPCLCVWLISHRSRSAGSTRIWPSARIVDADSAVFAGRFGRKWSWHLGCPVDRRSSGFAGASAYWRAQLRLNFPERYGSLGRLVSCRARFSTQCDSWPCL